MSVASYFMYHYAPWREDMSGEIKPHCMGMEFPKRDTDGPHHKWKTIRHKSEALDKLPSAADLDAVADAQRVKEKTSGE